MERNGLASALRRGLWVWVALIGLTVVEYLWMVAHLPGLIPFLLVINLIDAGLIVYYYMHIAQLWREEE
ncbi:hypothetical protein HRbin23_01630 [bacterium HR23]|nr:hypothetical protein HRbin23_01630 [bacterium HR23]